MNRSVRPSAATAAQSGFPSLPPSFAKEEEDQEADPAIASSRVIGPLTDGQKCALLPSADVSQGKEVRNEELRSPSNGGCTRAVFGVAAELPHVVIIVS